MKDLMFCFEPVHLSQILCSKLPFDSRTWVVRVQVRS